MSLAVIGTVAAVAGVGMSAYSLSQSGKGGSSGQVQETAQGRKAADIAAEQYNMYMKDVKPTEEKFIADVMKPTDVLEAREAGKVNADTAQRSAGYSSNNTPDNLIRTLAAPSKAGMDLSSSTINARLAVQDKKLAGLQAITDIGEGKRSTANLGMNSLAADAQKVATANAVASENKRAAIINGTGSLIGAVGGVAKNWPTTPTTPAIDFNGSSGTVENYSPYTDYSGAGMTGPWAPPVEIPVTTAV